MKFDNTPSFVLSQNVDFHFDDNQLNKIFLKFEDKNNFKIVADVDYDYDKNVFMDTYVKYRESFCSALDNLNLSKLGISSADAMHGANQMLVSGILLFILDFMKNEMEK